METKHTPAFSKALGAVMTTTLKRGDRCETRYERPEKCTITGFVNVPKYDRSGSEQWCRVRFDDGARLVVHPTGLIKCASL